MLDDKDIRIYISRFVCRFIAIIAVLWLICFLSTFHELETENRANIWEGYDPSRPVTDISHFDYENMRVTYHNYPNQKQTTISYQDEKQGVMITTKDGKQINTQLTTEELFEQLDLEYEDLYEYYMD